MILPISPIKEVRQAVEPKPTFSISVREIVDFVLKTGDLTRERDFFSPSRALQGIRAHQKIQQSRPSAYEAEVSIGEVIEHPKLSLILQGRIDGVLTTETPVLLEEIKSTLEVTKEPEAIHWAQLKMYGALYCKQNNCSELSLRLTYAALKTDTVMEYVVIHSQKDLIAFYDRVIREYIEWLVRYCEWIEKRSRSIQQTDFPMSYRTGQKLFVTHVGKAIANRHNLFAEAPTGMGKTISTLFPAVQAMGKRDVNNIFYLTAKTVGRTVAEKSLRDLREAGMHLRAITLTAKEKICSREGSVCDVEDCPFAKGHFDRLKDARKELFNHEALNRATIEELASEHKLCPYEYSRELAKWCDIIIGDYNYVFDPGVYLRYYFTQPRGDYVFLVDEAHNLPDRAREMYSADLIDGEIRMVIKEIGNKIPSLSKSLKHLLYAVSFEEELDSLFRKEVPQVSNELPEEVVEAVQLFLKEAGDWLARNEKTSFRDTLLNMYFKANHFFFVSQIFDSKFVTMFENNPAYRRLRLFCMDPSVQVNQTLQRARSSIFFSATLTPIDFYRRVIGSDDRDQNLNLPSPFPRDNLGVMVASFVSTTYEKRAASYRQIAEIISRTIQAKKGNYLVFFPSFSYLKEVQGQFKSIAGTAKIIAQVPKMSEEERENFLGQFHTDHNTTLVGFSVMGGVFGEGIDLIGDRLIGTIIVGVGLPQLCLERDTLKDYYTKCGLPGFDYAYTFPGMNRVLQAAGRVIRTEEDKGIVLLIDYRFSEPRYRTLFPEWWTPLRVKQLNEISSATQQFWSGGASEFDEPFSE